MLHDMADWLTWVARMRPEDLALQPLRPLVEGVALLLRKVRVRDTVRVS